ncbi:MAG TPA: extracellular solute-binding protein [Gryllotalpicola sp.]
MKRTHRGIVAAALAAVVGVVLAGCAPGSSSTPSGKDTDFTTITKPVTAAQVADLGDVTLKIWADAGEKDTLDTIIGTYEKSYSNVKVDVTYKDWDDLMSTVVNAMASDNPPDIANGNQGFATMGTMVKGKMIRPLDDFVKAYGLDQGVPASGFDSYRWNDAGTSWGTGSIVGVGGATQPLGVFYNKAKLDKLGLKPPQTLADLEADLKVAKAGGEIPIQLGNSDQYPLGSHLLGILIDMFATPDEVNAWIAGGKGTTFDMPGVQKAVKTLQEWGDAGYFPAGYDGTSLDEAVADYAKGQGVFFLGGSFNGSTIAKTDPNGFGFTLLQNDSGKYVTTGTFGTPWHISSKSKVQPAALAFLGLLLSKDSAQVYADTSRLPNYGLADVKPTGAMHEAQLKAAQAFFANGDFVGYLDWATPTMQATLGAGAQELLAGKTTPEGFIQRVQKDWSDYQSGSKG